MKQVVTESEIEYLEVWLNDTNEHQYNTLTARDGNCRAEANILLKLNVQLWFLPTWQLPYIGDSNLWQSEREKWMRVEYYYKQHIKHTNTIWLRLFMIFLIDTYWQNAWQHKKRQTQRITKQKAYKSLIEEVKYN